MKTNTVTTKMAAKKAMLSNVLTMAWAIRKESINVAAQMQAAMPKKNFSHYIVSLATAMKQAWKKQLLINESTKNAANVANRTENLVASLQNENYELIGGLDKILNEKETTVEIAVWVKPLDTRLAAKKQNYTFPKALLAMKNGQVYAKGLSKFFSNLQCSSYNLA